MGSKKALKKEENFWHINHNLSNLGATYVSLLMFNSANEIIFSKSSNPEWADEFTSTGLYKECHLLSAANELMNFNENSFTLAWDLCLPMTNAAKELDEIRKYKDISHGVGFCIKNKDDSKLILNIAGKYADINFGLNILKTRQEVYKNLYTLILNSA